MILIVGCRPIVVGGSGMRGKGRLYFIENFRVNELLCETGLTIVSVLLSFHYLGGGFHSALRYIQ